MSELPADGQRSGTRREAQEVAYEFFALRESISAWRSAIEASRPMLPQEWSPSGMYIESWFIHARNILDFLDPAQKRSNTLWAKLFVADWEEVRPPLAGRFDQLRNQVNRMVAHLTRERAFDDRTHLEVRQVYEYADLLEWWFESFLQLVPESMAGWFRLDALWFVGVPTDFRAEDLRHQSGHSDC